MAGSPIKAAKDAKLDAVEEKVFEMVESGMPLYDISRAVRSDRGALSRWLNKTPERAQRYAGARARAADHVAEDAACVAQETFERAREGKADKSEVAAAKLVTEVKRWTAGIWNRDKYGDQQAAVTVNVGVLHLDALRQSQAVLSRPGGIVDALPAPRVIEPDALQSESLTKAIGESGEDCV
ncbi:MAG: hypothetical protein VB131_00740 [Burkholderia gladioli]